jgi:putative glutathione S-transferase
MTASLGRVASPVDFDAYGDYAPPPGSYEQRGDIATLTYPIGGRITDDGSSQFRAEAGRYHLYYSYYCPWAQRPMIALKLRGLDGVVTSSAVDPVRDGRGWAFRAGRGHGPDPVNGFTLLQEAYLATDPGFAGHISVPALWDRETHRLVSNHYATMTVDLETQFAEWADAAVELDPEARRDEIDSVNAEIVGSLSTGAYAAMAVTTQEQYDAVSDRVFAALERFDARLADRRFLLGDAITDADLLLYVQLVRFDLVAVPLGRLTRRRLVDHPNLWAYARDLYQRPAFRVTTNFDHIARGTFGTGAGIRTNRVVPAMPEADWDAPHGRDALASRNT